MKVLILTESELREAITIDREAVAAIEQAFGLLAEGKVNMPPIMHIEVPEFEGDVDIKSAYVQGLESFAVKIGAGARNRRSRPGRFVGVRPQIPELQNGRIASWHCGGRHP